MNINKKPLNGSENNVATLEKLSPQGIRFQVSLVEISNGTAGTFALKARAPGSSVFETIFKPDGVTAAEVDVADVDTYTFAGIEGCIEAIQVTPSGFDGDKFTFNVITYD